MKKLLQIVIILLAMAPAVVLAQSACDPMPNPADPAFNVWADLDCDGDGIKNSVEYGGPFTAINTDGDSLEDWKDKDSDNDGISDLIETGGTGTLVDSDGDGIPNYLETDSDNDGVSDAQEALGNLNADPHVEIYNRATNFVNAGGDAAYTPLYTDPNNNNAITSTYQANQLPIFARDNDANGKLDFLDPTNTTYYRDSNGSGLIDLYDEDNTPAGAALIPNGNYTNPGVANPLPVSFIFFRATPTDEKINLNWETAIEINNDYFQIERSTDGRKFKEIGRITGKGNSTARMSYQFTDERPHTGTSYYRLRQVDFDGTASFSQSVAVRLGKNLSGNGVSVYPTLVQNAITVQLTEPETQPIAVMVYDLKGSLFYSNIIAAGQIQADVNLPTLPAGVYVVTVTGGDLHVTERVIKQ